MAQCKDDKVSIGDTTVPVVVLYAYHYGQLGVIRSFGRHGVKVHAVDPHSSSPGLFSRYCRRKFLFDVDAANPKDSVQFLLDAAKKIGKIPVEVLW